MTSQKEFITTELISKTKEIVDTLLTLSEEIRNTMSYDTRWDFEYNLMECNNVLSDLEYANLVEKESLDMDKLKMFWELRPANKSDSATNKQIELLLLNEDNEIKQLSLYIKKVKNKLSAMEKWSSYLNGYFFRETQATKRTE